MDQEDQTVSKRYMDFVFQNKVWVFKRVTAPDIKEMAVF